jgi:Cu+-exporting ATPase
MRNMRQNLFFAFFYNAIGVPLAAAVFYTFFDLLLSSIFAAVVFLHMKIPTRNQQMA